MVCILNIKPISVFSAYNDYFDTYSVGDLNTLNGGSGFSGAWNSFITCNTNFDVSTNQFNSSPNAVEVISSAAGDRNCGRTITEITDSSIHTVWIRTAQTNQLLRFGWQKVGTDYLIQVDFRTNGNIAIENNLTLTDLQAYSANTWYKIEVTPDFATEQFTIEINDVSYGPYFMFAYGTYTYDKIDAFLMQAKDTGTGTFYIDTLGNAASGGGGSSPTSLYLDVGSTSPTTTPEETAQIVFHSMLITFICYFLGFYLLWK